MTRLRARTLLAAGAVLVAACSSRPAPISTTGPRAPGNAHLELASFTGRYDPATGAFTFETVPSAEASALTVFEPWLDGSSGHGPANTFEIRNGNVVGATNGCPGGLPSFGANIAIQSFFRDQRFEDVYAEIVDVVPLAYAGCSTTTAPPGASNDLGLWSYGAIERAGDPGGRDVVERSWQFRRPGTSAFWFRGRILGRLAAPVPLANGPEFDWTPTSIVDPPRTFVADMTVPIPTTLAHVVWNGAAFFDAVNVVTYVRQGGSLSSVTSGLDGSAYATFPGGAAWKEPAQGAGLDLSGDFTVCAKIKPGALPASGAKVILASGDPSILTGSSRIGWALVETPGGYGFQYRTAADEAGHAGTVVMTEVGAGARPETYAYDYVCGGRAGNALWVKAHGGEERSGATTAGSFAGTPLPLVVGDYEDGLGPTSDLGVYEFIIDSRPPAPNVMHELVGTAEGYQLRGWLPLPSRASAVETDAATMPTYVPYDPTLAATAQQLGGDGQLHVLPPYASVPVSSDGSGLLDPGALVHYLHPLVEDTSVVPPAGYGFCAAAEVVADAGVSWADVHGTLFSYEQTNMAVHANPFTWAGDTGSVPPYDLPAGTQGWEPGTAHVFKVCGVPDPLGHSIVLYLDDQQVTQASGEQPATGPFPDFSAGAARLAIGAEARSPGLDPVPSVSVTAGGGPLTNARIRRVFICPDADYRVCQ